MNRMKYLIVALVIIALTTSVNSNNQKIRNTPGNDRLSCGTNNGPSQGGNTIPPTEEPPTNDVPNNTNKKSCPHCRGSPNGNCIHTRNFNCVDADDKGVCPSNYELCDDISFMDHFDTLNLDTWSHDITMAGGGNWEFQMYLNNRSNSYVENGSFFIVPRFTNEWHDIKQPLSLYQTSPASDCTTRAFYGCERAKPNPITSAKVTTQKSFSFTTGRLEVRAKLPRGDWLWPAIWLLPMDDAYGTWPSSGEIDIMESRGNKPSSSTDKYGRNSVSSALHWGINYRENKYKKTIGSVTLNESDFSNDFHIFGLVKTKDGLYTYLDNDDTRILSVDWRNESFFERGGWGDTWNNPWVGASKGAPFDRSFYIVLNLAVGGTSGYFDNNEGNPWIKSPYNAGQAFWDDRGTWEKTWDSEGRRMQVDWIKVSKV